MNYKISPKVISLIFGILVICFAVGFYIFAWTGPTASPPNNNTSLSLGGSLRAMWITSWSAYPCSDQSGSWFSNSPSETAVLLNAGGNSLLTSTESKTWQGYGSCCGEAGCLPCCTSRTYNNWIKCADGLVHRAKQSVGPPVGIGYQHVIWTHTCSTE